VPKSNINKHRELKLDLVVLYDITSGLEMEQGYSYKLWSLHGAQQFIQDYGSCSAILHTGNCMCSGTIPGYTAH